MKSRFGFFGDVLSVFKTYHKMIQSDSATLLDLEEQTSSIKAQLRLLLKSTLLAVGKMRLPLV